MSSPGHRASGSAQEKPPLPAGSHAGARGRHPLPERALGESAVRPPGGPGRVSDGGGTIMTPAAVNPTDGGVSSQMCDRDQAQSGDRSTRGPTQPAVTAVKWTRSPAPSSPWAKLWPRSHGVVSDEGEPLNATRWNETPTGSRELLPGAHASPPSPSPLPAAPSPPGTGSHGDWVTKPLSG